MVASNGIVASFDPLVGPKRFCRVRPVSRHTEMDASAAAGDKPVKTKQPKKAPAAKTADAAAPGGEKAKKQTGLALSVRKEDDFADWYTQTIVSVSILLQSAGGAGFTGLGILLVAWHDGLTPHLRRSYRR